MQEMAVLEGSDFTISRGEHARGSRLPALGPLFTNFLDPPLIMAPLPTAQSWVASRTDSSISQHWTRWERGRADRPNNCGHDCSLTYNLPSSLVHRVPISNAVFLCSGCVEWCERGRRIAEETETQTGHARGPRGLGTGPQGRSEQVGAITTCFVSNFSLVWNVPCSVVSAVSARRNLEIQCVAQHSLKLVEEGPRSNWQSSMWVIRYIISIFEILRRRIPFKPWPNELQASNSSELTSPIPQPPIPRSHLLTPNLVSKWHKMYTLHFSIITVANAAALIVTLYPPVRTRWSNWRATRRGPSGWVWRIWLRRSWGTRGASEPCPFTWR